MYQRKGNDAMIGSIPLAPCRIYPAPARDLNRMTFSSYTADGMAGRPSATASDKLESSR